MNEPAERLRAFAKQLPGGFPMTLLDAALAAERKAGADGERERIRAVLFDSGMTDEEWAALDLAILDAEPQP